MTGALKSLWRRIIRCFLAGIFAVLPLVITVAVVVWVADFVAGFIGPDTVLGKQLSAIGFNFLADSPQLFAYVIGWTAVLAAIFALGIFMELGAKKLIQRIVDGILTRVPLLGNIYSTSKQVVQMLDKKDEDAIKSMSAVFCFFGREHGAGVLALLVSPDKFLINNIDYHAVIVPTAPVPFGGGLFFVPVKSTQPAKMSVDGLMSIYVSMGVTASDYLPSGAQKALPDSQQT